MRANVCVNALHSGQREREREREIVEFVDRGVKMPLIDLLLLLLSNRVNSQYGGRIVAMRVFANERLRVSNVSRTVRLQDLTNHCV